jgi:hypothetical protein
MPRDRAFFAKEVHMVNQGRSWSNLESRELLMRVGKGGYKEGFAIKWQLTSRAKRLLAEGEGE